MFDEDYGVQSYFGESGDCDFFGDTSMSGGFASGMGGAGFVSEAFAQDSMGGSFFTEASEFDAMGGEFFTEANNSTSGSRFGDMAESDSRAVDTNSGKATADVRYKDKTPQKGHEYYTNTTHVDPLIVKQKREVGGGNEVAKKRYDAAKRHGSEISRRIESNK